MSEAPLRVVIAEPHDGMRQALHALLAAHDRIHVAEAVGDLLAAGQAVRALGIHALVVDAGLLDAGRFELGPLPAATSVVVLGMEDHPDAAEKARRGGASAYVVKDQAHLRLPAVLLGEPA